LAISAEDTIQKKREGKSLWAVTVFDFKKKRAGFPYALWRLPFSSREKKVDMKKGGKKKRRRKPRKTPPPTLSEGERERKHSIETILHGGKNYHITQRRGLKREKSQAISRMEHV